MKVGHAIGWFAVSALLVIGVALLVQRPRRLPPEPSYGGHTITEWVMCNPLALTAPPRSREARDAIRHIGTNALPCLVAWLKASPPYDPFKQAAYAVSRGFPDALGFKQIRDWSESDMIALHFEIAPVAFKVIGASGAPAIPELEKLASDSQGKRSAYFATCILADIGPQAVPALERIASNPQCSMQHEAARLLIQIRSQPPGGH